MSQPIVSDAGPIITFARANRLGLLRQVVGRVVIPGAVYDEIVVRGSAKPGATEVKQADWVELRSLAASSPVDDLPGSLGQGEKEAIALCRELQSWLLVDDPAARREAKARGIPLISTLDILDEAKDRGFIAAVAPVLDSLIRNTFRLKVTLYEAKLREAGERP